MAKELDNYFLNLTPKEKAIGMKINFCMAEETINKMKRKKIFANFVSQKGFIARIYT